MAAMIVPIRHKPGQYVVAMVTGDAGKDELTKAGRELAANYGITEATGC